MYALPEMPWSTSFIQYLHVNFQFLFQFPWGNLQWIQYLILIPENDKYDGHKKIFYSSTFKALPLYQV